MTRRLTISVLSREKQKFTLTNEYLFARNINWFAQKSKLLCSDYERWYTIILRLTLYIVFLENLIFNKIKKIMREKIGKLTKFNILLNKKLL